MAVARVTFHRMVQDSQEYSSFEPNDAHMISCVFFTLEINDDTYQEMCAEVKQPYGTDYETEPCEVSRPEGPYTGNWNHHAFSHAAERYYRSFVGSAGIRIQGGGQVRMRNNTFIQESSAEFEIPD